MKTITGCLFCAMLVGACGQDTPSRQDEPMPVEDTVFADQVKQIDRAKDQAAQMENRMQDLNRELETAEGARSAEPQE